MAELQWHPLTTRDQDPHADDWYLDVPYSRDTIEIGPDDRGYSIVHVQREEGGTVAAEVLLSHAPDREAAQSVGEEHAVLAWRDDLDTRIHETVDLVSFAASLDPDAVGYGQPHAYSEEFRALIREAQELREVDL